MIILQMFILISSILIGFILRKDIIRIIKGKGKFTYIIFIIFSFLVVIALELLGNDWINIYDQLSFYYTAIVVFPILFTLLGYCKEWV